MILEQLNINYLRSFSSEKFDFHPRYNYIVGENGSGKTTILESIYLVCSGHSFKTREIYPLVQNGKRQLILFARTQKTSLSLFKALDKPTLIKIDGKICMATSQLAYLMPCQIYYQDLFQIMDAGPGLRRAMLDWGMFHVKHEYLCCWKQYHHILKQRNSLLKQKPHIKAIIPWDEQLAKVGEQIAKMRHEYMESLKPIYQSVLEQLTTTSITLSYEKGWDKKKQGISLKKALELNHERDLNRGYTSMGTHHAEIMIESGDIQAKKILSRGQQKIALIALKLSQSKMLNQHCLHLMDDIFAELDANHQRKIANYIRESKDQFFITVMKQDKDKIDCFPNGNRIDLVLENN